MTSIIQQIQKSTGRFPLKFVTLRKGRTRTDPTTFINRRFDLKLSRYMTFVNLCNFEPISFSNMLLAASNSLLNLGVRPRAVTTPLRIRSPSGTWGAGMSSTTSKDLRPNARPAPTQTTHSAARKVHHFSTVHIPRLRERTAFDWKFHDEHQAQLTIFGPYCTHLQHVARSWRRRSPHCPCLARHALPHKQDVAQHPSPPNPRPRCSPSEPSRPRSRSRGSHWQRQRPPRCPQTHQGQNLRLSEGRIISTCHCQRLPCQTYSWCQRWIMRR